MADGVEDFGISGIEIVEGPQGWVIGEVRFHRAHTLPNGEEVADKLIVKVRATLPEDRTIDALHEALYRQTAETLSHTVARCEGQSGQALLDEARERAARERCPSSEHLAQISSGKNGVRAFVLDDV